MGKTEITLLIVGIILTIILAATMVPSFIKAGSFAKTSIVINEIKSIRDVMNSELSINNGSFDGLNAEKLKELLPGFELVVYDPYNSFFINKYNIIYNIFPSWDGNSYYLFLQNLNSIDTDVEEHIIEAYKHVVKNNYFEYEDTTDGVLFLELDN